MDDKTLWSLITTFTGETFHTSGRGRTPGKPFTYSIRGGEMFISTKAKSITKATVMIACRKAIEIQKAEGYVCTAICIINQMKS